MNDAVSTDSFQSAPRIQSPTSASQRGNNFDFIRLMLAVLVIFSHSYALGIGSENTEPLSMITHAQTNSGALAVDCFFILSGYLIAQSWQRSRSPRSYFTKRVARIYPAFIVAMAVCIFVVWPAAQGNGWGIIDRGTVAGFLVHTANLDGTMPGRTFLNNISPGPINGSLWSIRFEFWCYIGLALLGAIGALKRPRLMLTLFVTCILIHVAFVLTGWNPGFKIIGRIVGWPLLWSRMLPLFLAGTVYAVWQSRVPLNGGLAAAALAILALAALIPHLWIVLFPFAGAYLLFWLGSSTWLPMSQFGRYGDFSYGTYLYAFPIQQLLVRFNGGSMNPHLLFIAAAPIAIVAGIASWYLIERHFLKARGRAKPSAPVAVKAVKEPAGVFG